MTDIVSDRPASKPSLLKAWMVSPCDGDDLRAIARAMGLCLILWGLKLHLILWYLFAQHFPLFDELPGAKVLLLGGLDFVFCAGLAVFYRLLMGAAAFLPPNGRPLLGAVPPAAVHTFVAVFSVVSWQINQLYGWPMEIGHLRAAGDLGVMWGSIRAYLGPLQVTFLAAAVLSYFVLSWPITSLLCRLRLLRSRWRLWSALLATAAVIGGLWYAQMQRIYVCGLKHNAVVNFIAKYRPPLQAVDLDQLRQMTSASVRGREDEFLAPTSLHEAPAALHTGLRVGPAAKDFNVVLIIIESTCADRADERTTPNLLRLARTGLSLKSHYTTAPHTNDAVYSILYSDYMLSMRGGGARRFYGRPMPQPSLVSRLNQAGYQTAMFYSGHIHYLDYRFILEDFQARIGAGDILKHPPFTWGVWEHDTVRALSDWVRRHKDRKFFLTYATILPHHPYVCPLKDKPYPTDTWFDRYRNTVYYVDACVGQVIDLLEREGLRDNTLIVELADHGETASTYPVGHGLALNYEEDRVPCVFSNPRIFPSPAEIHLDSNHLDVAPTLLHLLGLEAPGEWLGRDLLAPDVPPRMLFVRSELTNLTGIVDNGLFYALDGKSGHAAIHRTLPDRLVPLANNDPRRALMSAYRDKAGRFKQWVLWRHLERGGAAGRPASRPAG